DVLCFGESTGEITVTASGGTGTLQYAISPAFVYGSANVFTGLPAGDYTVRVTDGIGCEVETVTLTITEPTAPLSLDNAATTDEICYNAADGTVTLTISGGTAPYSTSIDSNNPADFTQDQLVYTGLTAGTHTIYMTDAHGCAITPFEITINEGVDMTPSATVVDNCTNNVPGNEVTVDVTSLQTLDPADLQYSLDGTNYQASNVFNNLAPGNYTAYVRHANGCVQTTTFTINVLQPVTASAVATTDVGCKGESTGEITVTASGGTGTLQYAISPDYIYGSSNVFSGLAAGSYTVMVTDGIGCEVILNSVQVTEPVNALTSTIDVVTDEICFNAQDGTVTISVTGGTPPYYTSLDSNNPADYAQDVFTYTGLAAGTHTIYVTDDNGCSIPVPLTFDIEPGVSIQPVVEVYPTCTNNVPGNVVFVLTNPSINPADLTYSLDGVAYQTDNYFANLTPGNYTAYIQHINGCVQMVDFTIDVHLPIVIDSAVVTADVLCYGDSIGEITVTASGGTGTLLYAISSDAGNYTTNNVFTDLPAGTYTVTVRDDIGCETTTGNIVVDEPTAPLSLDNAATTDEVCYNAADGTVTLTISGGTAPYSTSIDSDNAADFTQDQLVYTNLTVGTHTIYVTDANGCSITPVNFTINEGADMTPSASVLDNCTNNVPGNEVTISVASSQTLDPADLTYSVDGTTYQASNVFNNLAPGNYTAYVQHANGCIETTTFTINTLQPITIDTEAVTADVSCKGEATGEITVTASGGTGTLQYAISPDFVYGSSNVFTNLPAGDYTVRVTDGIGCEVETATLTVNEPVDFLTSVIDVVTPEICFNAQDGTVTISVTGGTAPYYTSLDSNNPADFVQDVFTYTGLAAGTHTIYVTDANGCSIPVPLTFDVEPGADMTPSASVVDNCTNNVPGNEVTISVASSQTLDPADLIYSVDGTTYQASNVFNNLAPGNYTAYVQHANGCIETTTFTINTLQPITIDTEAVTADVSCKGEATGEITVTASGGTGTLQYAISPAFVYGSSNVFTNLPAGDYTVRVTDGIGCEVETATLTVNEPVDFLTSVIDVVTPEICFNAQDGTVTISVTGGTAPYSTSLDSNNPADFVQDVFTYTGLAAGTHTIYVTDANGCSIAVPLTFDVEPGADMTPSASVVDNCTNNVPGNEVTISVASSQTLDPADLTYSVDGTTYQASNVFNNLAPGNYTAYVQHANGCIETTTFTINTLQPITIDMATVVNNVLCFGEETGEVMVTASGGTGTLQYAISPDFVYGSSNVFTNLAAGTYTVRVTDGIGCEVETATLTITTPAEALAATYVAVDETCIGDANGSVTISVTGGTAPYSTSLDGVTFVQDQFTYTNLAAGAYTIYVTDDSGCTITPIDFVIQQGINTQPNVDVVANCMNNMPGNVVTINIDAQYLGDVQYSVDGINYQASNTFIDIVAGTHTAYVQHINGCIQTVDFDVEDHQPVNATATVTQNVICYGDDTGEIVVTATGGTGQLEYAISPIYTYSTNNTFSSLIAGTYTIRVRDELGCVQIINNVVITQSETQIIASADWTGETCYNANDGSITVTVSGGTAPYSTSLDGVTFIQDQFTYTNLNGGQHVLFVQDAAGCQIVPIVFNIEHGVVLNPVVEVTPICTNNVSLSMLTVTNINPVIVDDVMYSLDGVNYQSSNVFTDLPDGNYVVYVMHANGCVTTRNVMVRHEKPILGVLTVVDALCNGEDNGTITVNGSGGIGTLTYGIAPDFDMTENNVFNVAAGQYTVRVQDETGCYKEYTATVNEPSEIILTEVEVYPEICENDDNAAILIDITGGTAPYSTSMDMDEPFEVGKDMYTDLDGGQTYTIYVKDANGCVASIDVWIDAPIMINAQPELVYNCDENVLTVNVETGVQGAVTYSLNGGAPQTSNTFTNLVDGTYVVDVLHDSGCIDSTEPVTVTNTTALIMILAESDINEITATTTGGSGGYTYTLNGEDMGTDNVFEIYSTGTYVVTVTDNRGCVAEKSLYYEFVDILLPDVMSPNDDGINDTWAPGHAENYPNLEFFVFDRYGRKLATLRQGQEWDGRYNGQELPTGDYWYIVKLNNPEDDREFVGHFTIFR
ncbi:T9SS type B sorting domain-containing protein, partial [Flavobacterium rakeshii]